MKTIFEKIIQGELPGEMVYTDDDVVVIKDKYPIAPVHLLIITRKPITSLTELGENEMGVMTSVFRAAHKLVKQFRLEDEGYRIVVNTGPDAGQTIYHLHFHLLGGRLMGPMG
jgi:histidine triad (HIT) family protein